MSEPSDVAPSVPPLPAAQTAPTTHELAVDLAAFLPEGTELAAADPDHEPDPWDTGAPEPEVPAWALDPAPTPAAPPGPAATAPPSPPEVAPDPAVDALDRIDQELAAVDDALVALDAGAPESSPLLRELLGG